MSTIGDIKSDVANYLKKQVSDFVISSGDETVDMLLLALNNARRTAERSVDFYNSQVDALLSVGSTGGNIANATIPGAALTITGTLTPNVATTWAQTGSYNNAPLFTVTVSAVVYFLYYTGTQWNIGTSLTAGLQWHRVTTSLDPSGAYVADAGTGIPTVAFSGSGSIKTVDNVLLPIAGGNYVPVEFLDNETWVARIRRQLGRTWTYDPAATYAGIGLLWQNPIAVQQGQIITLYPATGSTLMFPIVVQLDAIRFLPDYTADANTDFFTLIAPEYLMWQGILEGNKLWSEFVKVEEGVVNEESIGQMAETALQSLVAWDQGVAKGITAKQHPSPPMTAPRAPRQRAA